MPLLTCAQCESSPADLHCIDEDLPYCSPCSSSLHGKKARLHHQICRLQVCDECEIAAARVLCGDCGGRGEALVLCLDCSSALHSKKARAHHKALPLSKRKIEEGRTNRLHGARGARNGSLAGDSRTISGQEAPAVKMEPVEEEEHSRRGSKEKGEVVGRLATEDSPVKLRGGFPDRSESEKKRKQFGGNSEGSNSTRSKAGKRAGNASGTAKVKNSSYKREKHPSDSSPEVLSDGVPASSGSPETQQEPLNSDSRGNGRVRRNPKRAVSQKAQGYCCSDKECDQSEISSSEDDETYGTRKIHRGSVSFEAFLVDADDLEDGNEDSGTCHGSLSGDKGRAGVQDRIRKMLELGLHPDTPEIEAQQALKNAQRLLTKHNLKQAEVMKGELTNNSALAGGMRIVELRSKWKNQQCGRFEKWIYSLAHSMAEYFDTMYFARKQRLLQVVFYGIKQNADCAGYAFAATFNRITKLSAEYVPLRGLDDQESHGKWQSLKTGCGQNTHTRMARISYRNGIVAGLQETVEIVQKKRKLGRDLEEENITVDDQKRGQVGDYAQSDSYTSDDGTFSAEDFDSSEEEVNEKKHVSKEATLNLRQSTNNKLQGTEGISSAICAIIIHSKEVGEEYLKEKGIKLRKRRVERANVWDGDAFAKGVEDSKKIDINQKGITDKAKKPRPSPVAI